MAKLILFNKPFQVLSQFSDQDGKTTLAQFLSEYKSVYPAGRLDYDSEGLLLLTDHGGLQHQISHPDKKMEKTYWAQVEGIATEDMLEPLRNGITLKDGPCKPAKVSIMDEPRDLWPRVPPIRERASIPTSWLAITISEGRNRQVRRMTAAVGLPTLRLIRYSIGEWNIDHLALGQHECLTVNVPDKIKKPAKRHHTKPTKKTAFNSKSSHGRTRRHKTKK